MKRLLSITLLAATALWISACGGATTNTANTNSNANTTKPTAAAPTVDALLALDKSANEAYIKGDSKFFEGFMSDKFVMYEQGQRLDKAASVKMISGVKCDIKEGWALTEPAISKINDDTYALTYKSNMDGSCTFEGKTEKMPPAMRAASIFVRNGDKWQGAFHAENMIIDPKAPPAAPAADKKEEPKKEEAKKEEPKKDDKPAANAVSNSNAAAAAPAGPTKSANTDVLTKAHSAGWEAFKNKDGKYFETALTSGFAYVDPIGGYTAAKADAIKNWTGAGAMKCEGITKTSFTDTFSVAISSTVEILTGKGNADGKCNGQPNGDLSQAAVYVKEGEAWKLAFMFEYTPMPAK